MHIIIKGMRQTTGLMCAALLGASLSAASAASATEVVKFSSWWDAGKWLKFVDGMETSVEGLGLDVDVQIGGVAFPQFLQQTTLASLSGNQPDYWLALAGWVPTLVEAGAVMPLDNLLSKEFLDKLDPASLDAVTVNGKLYAVPIAPGPITLQYNPRLLKKAGYNAPPTTWDELTEQIMAVCKLETNSGQKVFGIGLRTDRIANSGQWSIPIIYGMGGDVVDANGNPDLSSAGVRAAMEWVRDITDAGCANPGVNLNQTRALMAEGRAGFIFEGPWGLGLMDTLTEGKVEAGPDGDFWIAPMPADANGKVRTIANDHVLMVSSVTKNPELVAKILTHMASNKEFVDSSFEALGILITSNKELITSGIMGDDAFTQVGVEALPTANANPIKHPKWAAMMAELAISLQKVMAGTDIDAELIDLDRRVTRVLK
jgi:ABC-type glycerol-3-phosphate transport system substrate-binding protein